MRPTLLTLALMSTLSMATTAHAQDECRSTAADQISLAVTIYNSDLTLVKDAHNFKLSGGNDQLVWRAVSAPM